MLAPALTILWSSFLLFLVQPILAKQILPWFGGSAGVWTVCLVFFQMVLLFGYTYAHWLTRRVGSRQFLIHIALLILSCLSLPIIPGTIWKPGPDTVPALRILGVLAATIGLPYFMLASTAPLMQRWLSETSVGRDQQSSIYRLFALSNLGSLVGLLSYPFAIEPFATLDIQAWVWSVGYVIFVVCFVSYAWKRRQLPEAKIHETTRESVREVPPSPATYVHWVVCAALGSALLLAVTNQLTQNVASIPFLWIVPLSMYLLSFIVCFEGRSGRGWYERRYWMPPAMMAAGVMAWALSAHQANLSLYAALPIDIVGLFLGCVVCHGELARAKPSPEYLTHFYLSLSVGGALGGLLVGLVAPVVFNNYWEMPLALVGLAILGVCGSAAESHQRSRMVSLVVAVIIAALVLLLLGDLPAVLDPYTFAWSKIVLGNARWGCGALLIVSAVQLQRNRMILAVAATALLCTVAFNLSYYHSLSRDNRLVVRNFYGTLRVFDTPYGEDHMRHLMHGIIEHGSEVIDPLQPKVATTYYGESSGIGRTLLSEHRTVGVLRIGSVGLGAGTLAAYGKPGDLFRVYELNPAVLEIAQHQFSFLHDSDAQVEAVLGDARLSLERELAQGQFDLPEKRFDVLSLDAFSGDGIPVHLLTREAFVTYSRVIKPDGIMAFHLSNTYLDLPPVVEQIARDAGFHAILITDRPKRNRLTGGSDWVLVARNPAFFQQPEIAGHGTAIAVRSGLPMWTDQFSNLFQILK